MEIILNANLDLTIEDLSQTERLQDNISAYPLWPKWVRSDKVRKIKDLPIFPHIHDLILQAIPDVEIARNIQEHGLMLDEAIVTITSFVAHYRATVPKSSILARHIPAKVYEIKRKFMSDLDILEQSEQLLDRLKKRVKKMEMYEESLPIPLTTDQGLKEIREYRAALKDYVDIRKAIGMTDAQIQASLAKIQTHEEGFNLDKAYSKEGINERIKNPISRMKILGMVERLMEMKADDENVIDIEKREDLAEFKSKEIDLSGMDLTVEGEKDVAGEHNETSSEMD